MSNVGYDPKSVGQKNIKGFYKSSPEAKTEDGEIPMLADAYGRQITVVGESELPTGAATEAKQLPDNHQVTVSNQVILDTLEALADAINQGIRDNSMQTKIIDENGNLVSVTNNRLDVNATFDTTGLATDTKQDSQIGLGTTLNSLVETLQELIQRLAPLAGIIANTAQLRVVQAAVPSTAVTGPITSAQSIAEKAVGGISYAEKMARTNNTAIQSNIINCIGA